MDIHDYQHLLQTEPILTLEIHTHSQPPSTFHTTFLHQSAKLLSPILTPTFVRHANPVSTFGSSSFCVLNGKMVKGEQQLCKLVIMLIDMAQQEVPGVGDVRLRQSSLALHSLFQQYEELAKMVMGLTDDDLNPYWTLLNPILKWRQNRKLQQKNNSFANSSQAFSQGKFNSDYFLYRLNLLEEYLTSIPAHASHVLLSTFSRICQLSLLRHINRIYPQLLPVALQQPSLQHLQQQELSFIKELDQAKQKRGREKRVLGAYGTFKLPAEKPKQKEQEEEYTTIKEKWIRALLVPGSITGIFFILLAVLKK